MWQSADPILGRYLPSVGSSDPSKLAGMGGIYNPFNLGMYTYVHQNPVKLVDPNGNEALDLNFGLIGVTFGTDESSDQPFVKLRVGPTGLGYMSHDTYNFAPPEQVGKISPYEGGDAGAVSEGINIGAGLSAGISKAAFNVKLLAVCRT